MGFKFTFSQADTEKEIRMARDFLAMHDLGYPNYNRWVQRAEAEMLSGYKRTIIVISQGRVVGDLVYQPHKHLKGIAEIKNLRVNPKLNGRYFATFMLRQLEVETSRENFYAIWVDARESQKDVIGFFASQGYAPVETLPLYEKTAREVVMLKPLKQKGRIIVPESKLVSIAREHALSLSF